MNNRQIANLLLTKTILKEQTNSIRFNLDKNYALSNVSSKRVLEKVFIVVKKESVAMFSRALVSDLMVDDVPFDVEISNSDGRAFKRDVRKLNKIKVLLTSNTKRRM